MDGALSNAKFANNLMISSINDKSLSTKKGLK